MTAFAILAAVEVIVVGDRGPGISPFGAIAILIPNLLSAFLGRRIASEHEPQTTMRLAWNLIAAGVFTNAVRTVYELVFQFMGRFNSAVHPALGLRQVIIVISFILTVAGLIAMWSSFTALDFGLRLRIVDFALIACILLLVPPVVWSQAALRDAHSPMLVVRSLQFASPFLLAVAASIAVVLYRISRELGEGLMAVTLRCVAAAFAIRLLALVVTTAPGLYAQRAGPVVQLVLLVSAHWIYLLGLVYRRRLSLTTADLMEWYGDGRHPATQVHRQKPLP